MNNNQLWYSYGYNMGYWAGDKNFDVKDPHNQYSAEFRRGLAEGHTASNKALDKLARQYAKDNGIRKLMAGDYNYDNL